MANEIVKAVAKKANIPEAIAQIAVDTALNLLKTKLPPAAGGILDSFLSSGAGAAVSKTKSGGKKKKDDNPLEELGNMADIAGKLLGKK